jgi:dTDP-4-amino-4,6-dideoxygalactose transaminase
MASSLGPDRQLPVRAPAQRLFHGSLRPADSGSAAPAATEAPNVFIPLTRPTLTGDEMRYVQAVVESGKLAGGGPFGRRAEALLSKEMEGSPTLLTTSCTHALEMCALLLNLRPGDEVIVPSFTFVSTANAFALFGARPVFADVREDTLNIDPESVARLISPRTRAIVCVHYAGVACDMRALQRLATAHGILLIEDNAHGLFGRYHERALGSMGHLSTLSFHDTKNFVCGEGGALVVNDPALLERAQVIRDKGTDRSRFFKGLVDKYTWQDLGSSYVLSDILAAFLVAQLEGNAPILERRRHVYGLYNAALRDWAQNLGIRMPVIPEDCVSSWHIYHLVLPRAVDQGAFIDHMKAAGIGCAFHYVPLNITPYGQQLGGKAGDCPVSEHIAPRLVRMPLHAELSESDVLRVVETTLRWRPG